MALAIENALKYQQAENSATTDYLTGLPNARSLFLQLDRELARCKRDNVPLTVMVCDLDGFKKINDRFGHLEGNRVLRLFAHALKETCREYDYVARMGGDEFVIIAPGLQVDAAAKKIDNIRPLARQAGIDICGEDFLSLSVGLAVSPDDGNDAEQLLTEADRRMYLEKQKLPTQKDRRMNTRVKCRLTIEMYPESGEGPIFGNLIDLSLGGCYVETRAILAKGSGLTLVFSIDDGTLSAEGAIARIHHGSGVAVEFKEMSRESREKMFRIMAFVQSNTTIYNDRYMQTLLKR
jgi:diguanylate cyclase (GGDEF)-like protein